MLIVHHACCRLARRHAGTGHLTMNYMDVSRRTGYLAPRGHSRHQSEPGRAVSIIYPTAWPSAAKASHKAPAQRRRTVILRRARQGPNYWPRKSALMGQAIGGSLPLAIGIAISPIPIIAVVLMLTTPRAKANGLAFLAGWLLGLGIVGAIVLAIAGPSGASQ